MSEHSNSAVGLALSTAWNGLLTVSVYATIIVCARVQGAEPPVRGGGEAPLKLTRFLCLKH